MIVVSYQRTQAGAMKRMAERGRTFSLPLPAPKPQPEPQKTAMVLHIASPKLVERRSLAWPKLAQQPQLAVKPLPFSTPRQVILAVIPWHWGITVEDVMGQRRTHRIVAARFDAIVAVYENCRRSGCRYSLPEIGRAFGGRDHTSILNALRKRSIRL